MKIFRGVALVFLPLLLWHSASGLMITPPLNQSTISLSNTINVQATGPVTFQLNGASTVLNCSTPCRNINFTDIQNFDAVPSCSNFSITISADNQTRLYQYKKDVIPPPAPTPTWNQNSMFYQPIARLGWSQVDDYASCSPPVTYSISIPDLGIEQITPNTYAIVNATNYPEGTYDVLISAGDDANPDFIKKNMNSTYAEVTFSHVGTKIIFPNQTAFSNVSIHLSFQTSTPSSCTSAVNDEPIPVANENDSWAINFTGEQGNNTLSITCVDERNRTTKSSMVLLIDSVPPQVTLDSVNGMSAGPYKTRELTANVVYSTSEVADCTIGEKNTTYSLMTPEIHACNYSAQKINCAYPLAPGKLTTLFIACTDGISKEIPAKTSISITNTLKQELALLTPANTVRAELGNSNVANAYVWSSGDMQIQNVTTSVKGLPEDWVSVTPSKLDTIYKNSSLVRIKITPPASATEYIGKTYTLTLIAKTPYLDKKATFNVALVQPQKSTGHTPFSSNPSTTPARSTSQTETGSPSESEASSTEKPAKILTGQKKTYFSKGDASFWVKTEGEATCRADTFDKPYQNMAREMIRGPNNNHTLKFPRQNDGVHTYHVRCLSNAGGVSPSFVVSYEIDTLPPVSFVTGAKYENGAIKVSWNGTDSQSGIDTYDVEVNAGKGWSPWKKATRETIGFYQIGSESWMGFRSIATDHAGNTELKSLDPERTVRIDAGQSPGKSQSTESPSLTGFSVSIPKISMNIPTIKFTTSTAVFLVLLVALTVYLARNTILSRSSGKNEENMMKRKLNRVKKEIDFT